MAQLQEREIAQITVSSAILKFMARNRATPSSIILRASPDLFYDLVGKDQYHKGIDKGIKFSFFGVRMIPDAELGFGYCTIGWNN